MVSMGEVQGTADKTGHKARLTFAKKTDFP